MWIMTKNKKAQRTRKLKNEKKKEQIVKKWKSPHNYLERTYAEASSDIT